MFRSKIVRQGLLVLAMAAISAAVPKRAFARSDCNGYVCAPGFTCATNPTPPSEILDCSGTCGGIICVDGLQQCDNGLSTGYVCAFAC